MRTRSGGTIRGCYGHAVTVGPMRTRSGGGIKATKGSKTRHRYTFTVLRDAMENMDNMKKVHSKGILVSTASLFKIDPGVLSKAIIILYYL